LPYRFRLRRGLTDAEKQEERRLFSQRVSLAKQLRHERARPAPDAENLARLDAQLAAARTAAAEWDRALLRDHFELAFQRGDVDFSSATDLERLAQQLTDSAALLHFVVGDTQTTVLVATRGTTPVPTLDVRAYAIDITRGQLVQQVAMFNDATDRHLDTAGPLAGALYHRLLGPAREQLADRTQLIIVPDDALWTLPFQALRHAPADATADRDATVRSTLLPSVASWVLRPPSASGASDMAAPPQAGAFATLFAAGTISDLSPLQSTLTLLPALRPRPDPQSPTPQSPTPQPPTPQSRLPQSPTSESHASASEAPPEGARPAPATPTTAGSIGAPAASPETAAPLAAWELFDHPLKADLLVVIDRSSADEQIRLDQGRLGVMGLAWAAQVAGVPRLLIARRALDTDERERILRELASLDAVRRPSISTAPAVKPIHESPAFILIAPPELPLPPIP